MRLGFGLGFNAAAAAAGQETYNVINGADNVINGADNVVATV